MWWVIYIVRDNEWITTWQALLALRRTTMHKGLGWFWSDGDFFFFLFMPTHLKHTTYAFLVHTHTTSLLSRLFLMKFFSSFPPSIFPSPQTTWKLCPTLNWIVHLFRLKTPRFFLLLPPVKTKIPLSARLRSLYWAISHHPRSEERL